MNIMGKRKYIWIAQMPEIFGYGICVASLTRLEAFKSLRKAFYEWNPERTFADAYDFFGGNIKKIELNKSYYDNFKC